MILEQEKLDVLVKKRSNLFNWRGQFTPEFVEYILQSFTYKGDNILDPFSGSGTVLQESARLDLSAVGLEINPAAYAMSKFFSFCNLPYSERYDYCFNLEQKFNLALSKLNGQQVYNKNSDYRRAYSHLLTFIETFINNITDKQEKIFFLNLFFQSEKDEDLPLQTSLLKSFNYIRNCLLSLPYTEQPISAFLKDARGAGEELDNLIDFILTSPPYINVFNYHQNFRAIIEIFHFDILKVAQSEMGSNRKNRGNRFKTVIQYCLDMELAVRSFWKALKPNGKMVIVLGKQSNVRGTPFYNGRLIIEILEKCGGFKKIKNLEREFINKFGNSIKEDIIIVIKSDQLTHKLYAREIAVNHLEKSLQTSQDNVRTDIIEAIKNNDDIKPSPIFQNHNIIKNAKYST